MSKMRITPRLLEYLEKVAAMPMTGNLEGKSKQEMYHIGRTDGEVMLAMLVLRELHASELEEFDLVK